MTKSIPHAWLIDVDSTITEPSIKKVPLQIFEKLELILLKPEPLALVSGRSISWLEDRVTDPFEKFIKDPKILDNLFISGEFGAMSKIYKNGKSQVTVNSKYILPPGLINESKLIAQKYKSTVFFDSSKKTMVSVEMNDNLPLSRFRAPQKKLHADLENLVKKYKLQKNFDVQSDTIATNIKHKNANKGQAVKNVLGWLSSREIKPREFIVVGDSFGDSKMAIELKKRHRGVEFVFVGQSADLAASKFDFPIIFTKKHYWMGTLEYLNAHAFLKVDALLAFSVPFYNYFHKTP